MKYENSFPLSDCLIFSISSTTSACTSAASRSRRRLRTSTNYATEWDSAESDRSIAHLMRIKSNDSSAVVILNPVCISIPGNVGVGGSTYHSSGSSFSTGTTFDTPKFLAYTVYNGFSVSNWMNEVKKQELTRLLAASGRKY